MKRRKEDRRTPEKQKVVPGDIEHLFGLPFPLPETMVNQPVIAELPDEKLYVADMESGNLNSSTLFLTRTSRDGEVDRDFGRDGWVAVFLEIGVGRIAGLLPREDGGVLVMVKYGSNQRLELVLACFKADGALDPAFGEGGKIFHRIPNPAAEGSQPEPVDDALDAFQGSQTAEGTGTCIAAVENGGYYCLLGSDSGPAYALIRCQSDGQLDPGFNGTGFVTDGDTYRRWSAISMAVAPDGRATLVGQLRDLNSPMPPVVFWRFHPDGSLDHSFGDEGYAFFAADSANVDPAYLYQMSFRYAKQLPGGGIAACGVVKTRSPANVFQTFGLLTCLDASGKLLTTFNGGKSLLFGVLGDYETDFDGGGLGVQTDGKIVVGGGVADRRRTERTVLVIRFEPTGRIDSTFANGGWKVFSPYDFRINYMSNLLVDSNGKILGAGGGGPDHNMSSTRPFVFQMSSE